MRFLILIRSVLWIREKVIYDSPEKVFESREIDRVFKVYSSQITFEDEMPKQYLFNLK